MEAGGVVGGLPSAVKTTSASPPAAATSHERPSQGRWRHACLESGDLNKHVSQHANSVTGATGFRGPVAKVNIGTSAINDVRLRTQR
jgi:hypothetical protein